MLMYGRGQHNIVKQLSSNEKEKKSLWHSHRQGQKSDAYISVVWKDRY